MQNNYHHFSICTWPSSICMSCSAYKETSLSVRPCGPHMYTRLSLLLSLPLKGSSAISTNGFHQCHDSPISLGNDATCRWRDILCGMKPWDSPDSWRVIQRWASNNPPK